MRKLLRQELLTINYSSRYPNLSVAPLLMQMTQRSPRALFGFSRSLNTPPYSLLPPIQRANGKVGWKRRFSRYSAANCRAFTFYYYAYSRQTIAPPGPSLYVSSSPSPGHGLPPYRVSIVIGGGEGIAIPKILLVPTDVEYLHPRGNIALSRLPVKRHRSITNRLTNVVR